MRLGVLYSGGKDSTFATYLATKAGHEIACLISVKPESEESYMFHYPNVDMTSLQAEAMRIPRIEKTTKGIKEYELADLRLALKDAKREYAIDGVCSGAIASIYQKSRVDQLCDETGLFGFAPLWGFDQEKYLNLILENNFEAVIVSVSAFGLDESWLGRSLTRRSVEELISLSKRFGFNAALEGGEGETFVLDCPLFRERIVIDDVKKVWKGASGYLIITKAHLVEKEQPANESLGKRE